METENRDQSTRTGQIREELRTLYHLQRVDSALDEIARLRGELPLEVQDLEDEIEGLNTRSTNMKEEASQLQAKIQQMRISAKNAELLKQRYEEQQKHVRNDREFGALNSEIEFQTLEMEHLNKQIKECKREGDLQAEQLSNLEGIIAERTKDLEGKRAELAGIEAETAQQEIELRKEREALIKDFNPRLLKGYERIRSKSRNGLAVVGVVRGACGGCFNRVPPQRQLEIRMGDKLMICEYCGRLLIDTETYETKEEVTEEC